MLIPAHYSKLSCRSRIQVIVWLFGLASLFFASAAAAAPTPYCTKIYLGPALEISLYSPTMFRFRVSHLEGDKFPSKYEIPFVIGKTDPWQPVDFRRWTEGNFDFIETSALRIKISQSDRSWTIWNAKGDQQIYPSAGPTYGIFRDGYTLFDAASAFDQRTDYSRFEHWFYGPETSRYVDTYLVDDLVFDQFFIYGPGYDRLFQQLNDLVGPEPLLPKKAYGFFQTQHLGCKGSQSLLMQVANQLRERHIPADNLVVDYEWGDGCPGGDEDDKYWGGLDWAPAYTAPLSPSDMVARLHDMHFNVMLIHHSAPDFPHRAEYVTREHKREWTAHVYDETLWWKKLREELDIGIDGTWQDTRKNDITDSVIWKGLQDYYGSSKRALFMGNRNMVEVDPWELQRDDRFPSTSLLASRRYPFHWTGDAHTTWSELQWHIDAIANTFGPMAGIDYITADAYAADWKQQARWNQFLAFTPVARSHTMKPWDITLHIESLANTMAFGDKRDQLPAAPTSQSTDRENRPATLSSTSSTPTAEDSIRKNLRLRYRLLPYLYSEAYAHYRTGFPIVRPMVLAFPDDPYCNFNRERYEYMFGDAFLVAPVWADLNSMDVYLPAGTNWIDYWSKQVYAGGKIISYDTSDTERLPLFVKAGSIIPTRADAEWIDPSQPDDPVTLDVYPAANASSFTLYEDDGVTTLYQSDQFSTTVIASRTEESGNITLSIGPTNGNYRGKLETRRFGANLNTISASPQKILFNGVEMPRATDAGRFASAAEGWIYDAAGKTVSLKIVKKADAQTNLQILLDSK